MADYKLTRESVAKVVAILRADPRFTPALQKEIGLRAGKPDADGCITWRDAADGLFSGAFARGYVTENQWYDEIFAAHGTRIAE